MIPTPNRPEFPVRRFLLAALGTLFVSWFSPQPPLAQADEPPGEKIQDAWTFRDGDRIAFVGDTLIERDQRYGYLETLLTLANPDKTLVFRNLGWSGDTVGGVSRSGFDPPEAGFKQLIDQVVAVKPTVIMLGYGGNESFAGEAGLDSFLSGLQRLVDAIRPIGPRIVLLSPIRQENLGAPLPDPAAHNKDVARYTNAIRGFAEKHNLGYVCLDPHADDPSDSSASPLTDNGLHLTPFGYWKLALSTAAKASQSVRGEKDGIQVELRSPRVAFDGEHRSPGTINKLKASREGVAFEVIEDQLPPPPAPATGSPDPKGTYLEPRTLRVTGLAPGRLALTIDGRELARASAEEWAKGVPLKSGPELEQVERLRRTINKKNELFFYRWRPQNITYLFGFRKHEQGNNAVEIPQFDPLVAEQEEAISVLRKPVSHAYQITRIAETEASR
jgi:lysophospholipase L1-like esterase